MNLNVEVRDELAAILKAHAEAQGVSPDRIAGQLVEDALSAEIHPAAATNSRRLWELISDNMKDVPSEGFEKLPADGASQIDHYLYGHPKR